MWSNVISLDKCFDREIDYLLECVKNVKDMSYAVEESRDRIWIYLASICDNAPLVEEKITCIAENIILSFFKLRFFLDELPTIEPSHQSIALISALLGFDRVYEGNLVRRALAEVADFNLDGLYRFRLRSLTDAWQELADLASRLLSGLDGDFFDIASFITSTDGEKSRLVFTDGELYNMTDRQPVTILPLFGDDELDLLCAIVCQKPCEIVLDGVGLSTGMRSALKRIAKMSLD